MSKKEQAVESIVGLLNHAMWMWNCEFGRDEVSDYPRLKSDGEHFTITTLEGVKLIVKVELDENEPNE
jgi:hypothetical protein